MQPIAVYIQDLKTIAFIHEKHEDHTGEYYKTCEGTREPYECLHLFSRKEVKECIEQLGAIIAPSTRKLIGI